MNYKIGDKVRLQSTKPTSHLKTKPGWNRAMQEFLGKELIIEGLPDQSPSFYSQGWYFHFDWIEQKPTLSLEERIINKAKELDKKWKERSTQCA